MSIKVTATFAGQTFTRRTVRIYTHMLVGKPSHQAHVADAHSRAEWDATQYPFYVREAGPTAQYPHHHSDAEKARYAEIAAMTQDEYEAECLAKRLAKVEQDVVDGVFDKYYALTWCGRPDLAQKARDKWMKDGWYTEVHIVPLNS